MATWIATLKDKPWVAHLLRAVQRFANRLGSQFGAAITYFSVLALVPILLFAFAITGFVLTVVRPDLINAVATSVSGALGATDRATQAKMVDLIRSTLSNWKGVGIVGLLSAIYSGAGWMGNLKNAVRAQWRVDFDLQQAEGNVVKKTLVNLVTLVGLIVLIAVTFGLASVSTALTGTVLDLLGLSGIAWLRPVFQFTPIVFSVGAGWLLFMYLYTVLPEHREPWPVVRRGALLGAIGLGLLQYLTGFLFKAFAANKAAAIFGPVITLMLFFNIFAQLILFVAAWIATARHEAVPALEEKVRFPIAPTSERDSAATAAEPVLVPQQVAARSVQVGLGAGYVTGAATGLGLGAAAAWVFSKAVRGRRTR
jgi:membrane protein